MTVARKPIREHGIRSCYHDVQEDEWLLVQVPAREQDPLCSILEDHSIDYERVKGCDPWIQFEAPSSIVRVLFHRFPRHAFDVL
nr:hypothetical protein [Candidatus Sigynarchaeota archaeon]